MAQRDYYEVLGVDRNASADDLKSAFRSSHANTTLILIKNTTLKKNSKRSMKPMPFCLTRKKGLRLTGMAMPG